MDTSQVLQSILRVVVHPLVQANLGQGPKTLITLRRQLLMLLDVLKGFIPRDSPKFLKVTETE